ncbi:hypothetical protein [Nocardia altamirensis]|uniref:hypothetical protein n=1 Tax=Nocardia altamirensis TaxID=472158 RepID=UPI000AEB9714|nr:hypothetical protein [Nocardia altamirensis]
MVEVETARLSAPVEVPEGARRHRDRSWLAPLAAVVGGLVLIGWRASRYGSWMVDDAGITFAYARSVAEGAGPVLQPGVPAVEGFSNPTWLAVLVLGEWFGLFDRGTVFGVPDYVLYPKAIALLCCAGILAACYVAARRVSRWPALITFATGAALAAIPSFVIWCFSGLENPLFALAACVLAVYLLLAVLDGRLWTPTVAVTAGAIAAFAALTRPDGLIYLVAYPLVSVILVRRATLLVAVRSALYSGLAFAVPYGAYLVWRISEFGRLVPNTAVAKDQALPTVQDLTRAGDLVQYAGAPAVIAAVGVVGLALAVPSRWRDGVVAVVVPLALALVAYCVLEPDWMGQFRFATPVWVLAVFLVVVSVGELVARLRTRGRVLVALTLVGVLIPSGSAFASASESYRATSDVPLCWIVERFGYVFNGYADIIGLQQGSLFSPDMGGTSLTSRLRLIDMAGLTEAKIADMYAGKDPTDLSDYVFEQVKPTFVHTHGAWMQNQVTIDPRMDRDYYRIHRSPNLDMSDEDWVRKEVVRDEAQLEELRQYAGRVLPPLWPGFRNSGSCGPVLRPGQTLAS